LREQGVLAAADPARASEVDRLLEVFGTWLVGERGRAGETLPCYRNQAKTFLAWLPAPLGEALGGLDGGGHRVRARAQRRKLKHLVGQGAGHRAASVAAVPAHPGADPGTVVTAVSSVASWRLSELPRALPVDQVAALLANHDRSTAVGLRDHAVLLTLARLGLRGAEIAALGLVDIDCRRGRSCAGPLRQPRSAPMRLPSAVRHRPGAVSAPDAMKERASAPRDSRLMLGVLMVND